MKIVLNIALATDSEYTKAQKQGSKDAKNVYILAFVNLTVFI